MFSEKDVENIAYLARLSLTSEEKQAYARQLSSILNYFQQLAEVDTKNVEPLVTPTDMVAEWRADKLKTWRGSEAAVSQAPEKVGNLFKVPPVVGG
jgi:aspartyl-tRNA(Asn)/glutamyl-tRNA(Gln) amidotransferase subunit C